MKPWRLSRRGFLSIAGTAAVFSRTPALRAQKEGEIPDLAWLDIRQWGAEGRGWQDRERIRYFDRLPTEAEKTVREAVWNLSRDSSGMAVFFETDSPEIHVRYELFRDRIAMSHMPATGVSGVDLYGLDDKESWRWIAVARPDSQSVLTKLVGGLDKKNRKYMLYLPLYNGIDSLEIGVTREHNFEGVKPRANRPIVFYGTSITHGACASRPGMPHPAILGRKLNRPIINLGFSGNGKMELEVGSLICELEPAVFVIDCLPNMNGDEVKERTEPLVHQFRKSHPKVPVILVEDRSFTNSWVLEERRLHHRRSRDELNQAYQRLVSNGVKNLFYLKGGSLLGYDGEGATDGSHPSDLGFMRQAEVFEPVLREALG